ncbi:NAC domain-containing protein 21/22-like [Neltuma alba]|uniref:NAC domain-containing protein 21/22-like n=1 Tax=Neltuma alba TaxID=207710 RepID=UPI0010A2B639|nr:NAC domain-containing protein 21/22-like [Prosopis alba]XP_028806108.1 NAC domain-containing protein 21/22-like [Prosopis alba]
MSNISMVEAKLPPGFRFHPRDEELVCDYLMKKVTHCDNSDSTLMIDVDLNKCEPWEIPEGAYVGGKEWYFYTQRDRKYATGQRTNRATASGYWKATGKDRTVVRKGKVVGMRKTLVFYEGRAPKGKKTDWVMHEFRLQPPPPPPPLSHSFPKEDWVLCKVFDKNREEENGKAGMGSCYDDAGSSSLPELMDSYISFDQPSSAAHHHHQHEQVPCFSNAFPPHQTNPNPSNNTTIFNHHHTNLMGPPTGSAAAAAGRSFSQHDSEVLKAFLTQLTKMETQEGSPTSFEAQASQTYLSQAPFPNYLWNSR